MKSFIEARLQRRREEEAQGRAELRAQRLAMHALIVPRTCSNALPIAGTARSIQPVARHNARVRNTLVPLTRHIMRIRDGSACVLCGTRAAALAVHHIIPFDENWARVGDPRNLVTLCHRCHLNRAHAGSWFTIDPVVQGELHRSAAVLERALETPREIVMPVQKRLAVLGRELGRAGENSARPLIMGSSS